MIIILNTSFSIHHPIPLPSYYYRMVQASYELSGINGLLVDKIPSYGFADRTGYILPLTPLLACPEAICTHHHVRAGLIYHFGLIGKADLALLRCSLLRLPSLC